MKSHKKHRTQVVLPVILIALFVAGAIYFNMNPLVRNPYVQEYVPGMGNIIGDVDTEYFESHGDAYAIGADLFGHAVFKDPYAAKRALLQDYPDEVRACRECGALSPDFLSFIDDYAMDADLGDEAWFIGEFCDIYENSFIRFDDD